MKTKTNRKQFRKLTAELENEILELSRTQGLSYSDICRRIGISRDTFHRWKRGDDGFRERLAKAEHDFLHEAGCRARVSLIRKIDGFFETERRIVKRRDGSGALVWIDETETRKYYGPDLNAIVFALTNAFPDEWRRNVESARNGCVCSEVSPRDGFFARRIREILSGES